MAHDSSKTHEQTHLDTLKPLGGYTISLSKKLLKERPETSSHHRNIVQISFLLSLLIYCICAPQDLMLHFFENCSLNSAQLHKWFICCDYISHALTGFPKKFRSQF